MAVKLARKSPLMRMVFFNAPASTAFSANSMVTPNNDTSTTTFTATTSSSTGILGVLEQPIASTDSNYASIKSVPLLVDELAVWEVDVGAGTPTANYVQRYCDFNDASNVNVGAQSIHIFLITEFVSASLVRGNILYWATNTYSH